MRITEAGFNSLKARVASLVHDAAAMRHFWAPRVVPRATATTGPRLWQSGVWFQCCL